MPPALTPLVVVPLALVASYVIQRRLSARYDYQCQTCGSTFELPPGPAAIAPHMLGTKLVRCPSCGTWTWARCVPKR